MSNQGAQRGTVPRARDREPRRQGGRPTTRRWWRLVAWALSLTAVLWGVQRALRGSAVDRPPEVRPGSAGAPDPAPAGRSELVAGAPVEGDLAPRTSLEIGRDFPWKTAPKSFDGTCTISGVVEVALDLPFPERWTLVIEPSVFGKGRERAERRAVEMRGGERTFEERDLPMGGYRVWAQADGLNCAPQEVLLFRLADQPQLAGKDHAHLMLQLTRSGFVDGSVLDVDGRPVEGLAVTLEDRNDRSRRTVRTGPAGIWRVDDVRDGAYRVLFGPPDRPLIPAEDLGFVGPSHRFPDRVVPRLIAFEVRVLDDGGRPLAGASVRGLGQPLGAIEATTEADGIARVTHAPAGRYQLRVAAEGGWSGQRIVEIGDPDRGSVIDVRCGRER